MQTLRKGCQMYQRERQSDGEGGLRATEMGVLLTSTEGHAAHDGAHDGAHDAADDALPAGFAFENYDQAGLGPESLRAFVDACLGRPHFVGADAHVGLQVVRAIDAMYRSAKSGAVEACA